MTQLPYLNLGAGRVSLPGPQPPYHSLVDPAIYQYPLWHNVDRNLLPGIDECVDLFTYPWPWADNSFDGALCSHIVEHIPHDVRPERLRERYQDGWYAFFSELHRVLTPGALIHILAPYAWSAGAMTDPTHTRYVTEHTFTHNMKPEPDAPFEYAKGNLHLELDNNPSFHLTEMFQHLRDDPMEFTRALQTRINVVYELYVRLRVVK